MVPFVIEQSALGERAYDIYSRLLKDRIVMLGTAITDEVSNVIIAQLLFLQSEDAEKQVSMYLNTPGGQVSAGLALYDTMQFVKCPIATFCVGQASSMGAVLLAAGTKGKRFSLPNSTVMIHQPWGGAEGTASDIEIQAKEIGRVKTRLVNILAQHTGKDSATIIHDADRDFFMNAEEAKSYGIVDHVMVPKVKKSSS